MTTRSKDTTLTFSKAFALSEVDRALPAGTYRVVYDEGDLSRRIRRGRHTRPFLSRVQASCDNAASSGVVGAGRPD